MYGSRASCFAVFKKYSCVLSYFESTVNFHRTATTLVTVTAQHNSSADNVYSERCTDAARVQVQSEVRVGLERERD